MRTRPRSNRGWDDWLIGDISILEGPNGVQCVGSAHVAILTAEVDTG